MTRRQATETTQNMTMRKQEQKIIYVFDYLHGLTSVEEKCQLCNSICGVYGKINTVGGK